jgi:hypothetical protein
MDSDVATPRNNDESDDDCTWFCAGCDECGNPEEVE